MKAQSAKGAQQASVGAFALALAIACAPGPHAAAQWTEAVHVAHAAYPRSDSPSALVHAAANFDASQPLRLVVFLHGYMACTQMLMGTGPVVCRPGAVPLPGRNLADAHDAAGTNTLFVVPQLAFMKRSGRAGCFARAGCFRAFIIEVLAALPDKRLAGRKTLADVASITLLAHSAGYEAALAILQRGEVDALVHDVVLFDALYGKPEAFLAWAAQTDSARLLSLHLKAGRPAQHSAQLLRMATRKLGDAHTGKLTVQFGDATFASALAQRRVAIATVAGSHRGLPQLYIARVLRALEDARGAMRIADPVRAHTD